MIPDILRRGFRLAKRASAEALAVGAPDFLGLRAGVHLTENAKRLAVLRGRHAGKRIFVIGNGPSLRTADLDALASEVTVASNGIFLVFDKTLFRPTYFTVEDRLVAEDRADAINGLDELTKVVPRDLARWITPSASTTYVNFARSYTRFPRFSEHFGHVAYWGGTVTFFNLQLAHYLGAKEIVLLGVDHSYAKPTEQDSVAGNVITSKTADANHFDPRYFGPGYRWHNPRTDRMEQAYLAARTFLEAKGVRVVNATRGGKLEVFERQDLDDLLKIT